jgi:hypothetical protein
MVISFSNVAKVEQSFTDNKKLLAQRVDLIEPTFRPSDINEALRAASGLANPGNTAKDVGDLPAAEAMPATMYIFTDGGFAPAKNFKAGNLETVFVKQAGETQHNVAIVAFSTESNPEKPGSVQAFGRFENHSDTETTVEASLFLNGTLLDAKQVAINARDKKTRLPGAAGVNFDMRELDSGILKLQIDAKDQLAADNTAFAVVNLPRPAKVLVVSPGTEALALALQTTEAQKIANISTAEPALLETKAYADQAAEGAYDLIVYDQCVPKTLPACNTLFIGRLPPGDELAPAPPPGTPADPAAPQKVPRWTAGPRQGPPVIIDVDQVHPLTQLVQMNNVRVLEGTPLKGPPGTVKLIDSDIGALYAIGPRAGYEDAVLGFDIVTYAADGKVYVNTDWPRRRSFPVFVMNALKYLGGVRSSLAAPSILPGEPAVLRAATPVESVQVTSPRGDRFTIPRELQNTYVFGRTDELGIYEVREGSGQKVTQQFAVNLFDSNESDLTPKDLELGHNTVKAQEAKQNARQELWKWLLLGAIGVLIFEWYI